MSILSTILSTMFVLFVFGVFVPCIFCVPRSRRSCLSVTTAGALAKAVHGCLTRAWTLSATKKIRPRRFSSTRGLLRRSKTLSPKEKSCLKLGLRPTCSMPVRLGVAELPRPQTRSQWFPACPSLPLFLFLSLSLPLHSLLSPSNAHGAASEQAKQACAPEELGWNLVTFDTRMETHCSNTRRKRKRNVNFLYVLKFFTFT